MLRFATTTPPTKLKNRDVMIVSLVLAGLLAIMAVSQLYAFEDFTPLLISFGLGGGAPQATLIASLLVTAEVFALPFLLRMYLSPLFRIVSMAMGWLVAGIWLFITISIATSVNSVKDVGFLGTAVEVPFGWWSILFALILALLSGWASWGMWPKIPKHW